MHHIDHHFGSLFLALLTIVALGTERPVAAKTPVILDTDIGDDIDDTWALAMLLRSPELDPKLITTTYGKAEYRAKLIAKFLSTVGRTDIAVGLGAEDATAPEDSRNGLPTTGSATTGEQFTGTALPRSSTWSTARRSPSRLSRSDRRSRWPRSSIADLRSPARRGSWACRAASSMAMTAVPSRRSGT